MVPAPTPRSAEDRVLDAVKSCCERFGMDKVTVDDIAEASGVSRATIYRIFPGGRDVLFEALRVRELTEFFDVLAAETAGIEEFGELVVQLVVVATRELRADDHLALMLASEPGDVLSQLTVEGVPRIIRVATTYLLPMLTPYLPRRRAVPFIDLLVRFTISYFLAPSDHVDLGDARSAREFLRPAIDALAIPADHTEPNPEGAPL
jgi:AcrR family transcriptional regulator